MKPGSVAVFCLLALGWAPRAPCPAQPSPEVPWGLQRQIAVRATLRDYDARLQALLGQRLKGWQQDFLDRRAAKLGEAGERLARLAAQIRDRREVSWQAVGQDPDFLRAARAAVAGLLTADQLRKELAGWARLVEHETRQEMIGCFQQIVAWDLGLHFDAGLRGKVERAVRAIPVEQLVAADVSQAKLLAAIQAGLPGVILTDAQKASIAAAAGELARRGTQWVAVSQLSLPPDWTELLSGLAALGTGWAAGKGLEWIDRKLTGEPRPDRIAAGLSEALGDWNRRQLVERLGQILRVYRVQVLQFVQAEGDAAAKAAGIEIGP